MVGQMDGWIERWMDGRQAAELLFEYRTRFFWRIIIMDGALREGGGESWFLPLGRKGGVTCNYTCSKTDTYRDLTIKAV